MKKQRKLFWEPVKFGALEKAGIPILGTDPDAIDLAEDRDRFKYLLERVDWSRDLHFQTMTSIDTLDYSSKTLNEGSKVIIAAAGKLKRNLTKENPSLSLPKYFSNSFIVAEGILAIDGTGDIKSLITYLESVSLDGIALITLVDDAKFVYDSKQFMH